MIVMALLMGTVASSQNRILTIRYDSKIDEQLIANHDLFGSGKS